MKIFTPNSIVGQYVRFAFLPPDCIPMPLKVTAVTREGMLRLEGRDGVYAAHLFVVVELPQDLPSQVLVEGLGGGE